MVAIKERRGVNVVRSRSGEDSLSGMSVVSASAKKTTTTSTNATAGSTNSTMSAWRPGRVFLTVMVGAYLGVTVPVWWYGLQDAERQIRKKSLLPTPGLRPFDASRPGAEPSLTVLKELADNHQISALNEREKTQDEQQSMVSLLLRQQDDVRNILQATQQRSFLPLQGITEESHHLGNRANNYTYTKPIPIRSHPKLQTFTYFQKVDSCKDLPNGWPVDHPHSKDDVFGPNVDILGSLYKKRQEYAEHCPVDLDPFLPWIHDVIAASDGRHIEVIAHNKRRCRQDPALFQADQDNLEPQVALLQSVPVQRLNPKAMADLDHIPSHWKSPTETRYRLAPIDEADEDGKETRFICQFHMLQPNKGKDNVERIVVGETLSVYTYNYEHANLMHRRGQKPNPMLTRAKDSQDFVGFHNEQVWNAILHFQCPVPSHLQELVASGALVDNDIPSLYVDIVPIRTPPRTDRNGYNPWHLNMSTFDPFQEWGPNHVLPPVSQSGRWQNIPICKPAIKEAPGTTGSAVAVATPTKENYLTGCLWASAAFSTRGDSRLDTSTKARLLEWLTYHFEVAGFDKMIIYDNTEAYTNLTSLKEITDLFGEDRVIRIPWKHRVCNNNRPTHPNAGERSSQYAAEASCRVRYGPSTEWLISFDTDEYLVPQGDYTSMKEWLKDGVAKGTIGKDTHILNFFQIRAMLNSRFAEPYQDNDTCLHPKGDRCLTKRSNATFMESFCESVQFPKPDFTGRAKKQLYRPSFVLNHFVHYASVTRLINENPKMHRVVGYPYERRVVEISEAFMLHTKTTAPKTTRDWKTKCTTKSSACRVGIPWPFWQEENTTFSETHNGQGYAYNCYENRKIHTVMVGKLRAALQPYLEKWKPQSANSESIGSIDVHPNVAEKIKDFEAGVIPAVIATKIQGNSTIVQLEQALCLLKYAYNDRPQHDIIVFAATPITDAETSRLKAAAAPAKLEVHMDNPGLEKMIEDLRPDQLTHLIERCNVTDASQLTWKTKCAETLSWGRTTYTPIQYAWQAEFRSLHLWHHPAISKYRYMMWFDSDAFCTKVSTQICCRIDMPFRSS